MLGSYLSPDLKEEIYTLCDDINAIWERLDRKYGDEGKLIDQIMADIKSMKRTNHTPADVLKMINTIEKAHHDLTLLGKEKEISNVTIVAMIEERLPPDIESEWVKLVAGTHRESIGQDKFPHLLKLLLEVKQRIEHKDADIRKAEHKGKTHPSLLARLNDDRNSERRKYSWCWLHPDADDLPIWRCREFNRRSPLERFNLVKENLACYSCLQKGHLTKDCQLGFKCKEEICTSTHNQLLHEAHLDLAGKLFYNGDAILKRMFCFRCK